MSTSTSTSRKPPPFIVAFYTPTLHHPDPSGRTLPTILAFSDDQLEHHHDYIQYLFPLPERSPINPQAPVITREVRAAFLAHPDLRSELLKAFTRMLEFYGFASPDEQSGIIQPGPDFEVRAKRSWRKRFDHNHLRITRIIRSLRVLGLEAEAGAFLAALLANDEGGRVSERSKMFWRRAAERALWVPPQEEDESARGVGWLRDELGGGGGEGG